MKRVPNRWSSFVWSALAGLAWVLGSGPVVFAQLNSKEAEAWKDCQYQPAMLCTRCHDKPKGGDVSLPNFTQQRAGDVAVMTEYTIWKTYDKHAQAYAVLKGPRGRLMGQLLGGKEDYVLSKEAGCLSCHAMQNLAKQGEGQNLDMLDGVSCAGCHGPSSKWLDPHINANLKWRDNTPEDKFKLGMRDLRNPEVRATLCASCHIGNASEGKVVTHAMMAAGHPPLPPFEVALFSRNEPQHWRNLKDIPYFKNKASDKVAKNYYAENKDFQQTKLALIGTVVAFRETMKLVRDRATLDNANPADYWPELLSPGEKAPDKDKLQSLASNRWPELAMAHSDCYACHHDLKYPGFRQVRGFGYHIKGMDPLRLIPGRPAVREWSTSGLPAVLAFLNKKDELNTLHVGLKTLTQASNNQPFGEPKAMKEAADKLIKWADGLLVELNKAALDEMSALKFLQELTTLYEEPNRKVPLLPGYESARITASLIDVVYTDYAAKAGKNADIDKILASADFKDRLDLMPYRKRTERLNVVLKILGNPPGADEFRTYLKDIGNEAALDDMARKPMSKLFQFPSYVTAISNQMFNDGLLAKENVTDLQLYSDEEQNLLMNHLATYDPEAFKRMLRDLASKLTKP